MVLLDTCIMIDVLRGKPAAFDFVSSLESAPALSAVTVTELVAGCRNIKERRQIDRLLSHYVLHDINRDVAVWLAITSGGMGPATERTRSMR